MTKTISLGDICVFTFKKSWKVGQILQFAKCKALGGKYSESYTGKTTDISMKHVGVLCSWYEQTSKSERHFKLTQKNVEHNYIPVSSYLSLLSAKCLEVNKIPIDCTEVPNNLPGIILPNEFQITEECIAIIQRLILDNSIDNLDVRMMTPVLTDCEVSNKEIISISDDDDESITAIKANHWIKVGQTVLDENDKEILIKNKRLNDHHMTAAQKLIQQQFLNITSLQNTLYQQRKVIIPFTENGLQILHINGDHWITMSTCKTTFEDGDDDIVIYDSIFSNVNEATKTLLAKMVHTNKKSFSVRIANVTKQSESNDCGLFAIAYCTSISRGQNPSTVIYNQVAMRPHLVKCFEQGKIELFPITRTKSRKLHQNYY